MSMLEQLVPARANNDYRGSPVALWTFCLLAIVITGRSLIHFLKPDSGVNSIATIVLFSGDPDPNRVIYLFSSLWGTQQVIMAMLYAVVLLRYRNLVPLMYLLLGVEVVFRMIAGTLHPLTEEYYLRTPPGKVGNLPLLGLSVLMLFLSLRTRNAARSGDGPSQTSES